MTGLTTDDRRQTHARCHAHSPHALSHTSSVNRPARKAALRFQHPSSRSRCRNRCYVTHHQTYVHHCLTCSLRHTSLSATLPPCPPMLRVRKWQSSSAATVPRPILSLGWDQRNRPLHNPFTSRPAHVVLRDLAPQGQSLLVQHGLRVPASSCTHPHRYPLLQRCLLQGLQVFACISIPLSLVMLLVFTRLVT